MFLIVLCMNDQSKKGILSNVAYLYDLLFCNNFPSFLFCNAFPDHFIWSIQINQRTTTSGMRAVTKNATKRPVSPSLRTSSAPESQWTTTTTPSVKTSSPDSPPGEGPRAVSSTTPPLMWSKTAASRPCWMSAPGLRNITVDSRQLKNSGSIWHNSHSWAVLTGSVKNWGRCLLLNKKPKRYTDVVAIRGPCEGRKSLLNDVYQSHLWFWVCPGLMKKFAHEHG